MNKFLSSNEAKYRLARTIVQAIIGVIIANLDIIIGFTQIPVMYKPLTVAIVMAILSPIMAALGEAKDTTDIQQGYNIDPIEELNEDGEVYYDEYDCQN